jgi:hypothetical protein
MNESCLPDSKLDPSPTIASIVRARLGRRHAIIIGSVLLLLALGIISLAGRRNPKELLERIQPGMTEAEVEALWGPPALEHADPTGFDGKPIRMQPDERDGWTNPRLPYEQRIIIKIERSWWYDDEHVFWVFFDEADLVVTKSSPGINPPRSAIKRLLRRLRELFE